MNLFDQLIRSRRRSVGIYIKGDGRVVVRAPLRLSDSAINHTVEKHRDWITARRQLVHERRQLVPEKSFIEGDKFHFLGNEYSLLFHDELEDSVRLNDALLVPSSPPEKIRKLILKWYREQANEILSNKVNSFVQAFDLKLENLKITSAAKNWGSCTARGNLNFPWRLVMCPLPIIDYVVIHELAHLLEMNHSPDFWQVVKTMCPDYQERRAWLRDNSYRFPGF